MGQYGTIKKIIVNKDKPFNKNNRDGVSYSAYITYSKEIEAAAAIVAMDGTNYDNRSLKASFGLSKYCTTYIKNTQCLIKGCPYVHKPAKDADTFTKNEANSSNILKKIHNHGALDLLAKSSFQFIQMYRNRKEGLKFPSIKFVERMVKEHCDKNSLNYDDKFDEQKSSPVTKTNSNFENGQSTKITLSKWDWAKDVNTNNNLINKLKTNHTKSILTDNTGSYDNNDDILVTNKRIDLMKPSSLKTTPKNRDYKGLKFICSSQEIILDSIEDSLNVCGQKKISIDSNFSDKVIMTSPKSCNAEIKDNKSTTSTLNTTIVSENISLKDAFEIQIENALSQKPFEYSSLDRMILAQLNKTLKDNMNHNQITKKTDRLNILKDSNSNETKKNKRLERTLDIFLKNDKKVFSSVKFFTKSEELDEVSEFSNRSLLKNIFEFEKV